eukprot:2611751-Amphidinium_carterae.1
MPSAATTIQSAAQPCSNKGVLLYLFATVRLPALLWRLEHVALIAEVTVLSTRWKGLRKDSKPKEDGSLYIFATEEERTAQDHI